MKTLIPRSFHAAAAAALLAPTLALADVPTLDSFGRPARVLCNVVGGQAVWAVHADKIIFKLINHPQAMNANDQAALGALPLNEEMDIKVLDDPTTIADLKGKVLTFLRAVNNPANRALVKIVDVDYAMVCPLVPQPD